MVLDIDETLLHCAMLSHEHCGHGDGGAGDDDAIAVDVRLPPAGSAPRRVYARKRPHLDHFLREASK